VCAAYVLLAYWKGRNDDARCKVFPGRENVLSARCSRLDSVDQSATVADAKKREKNRKTRSREERGIPAKASFRGALFRALVGAGRLGCFIRARHVQALVVSRKEPDESLKILANKD